MPLFFFDVYNDVVTQAEEGVELPDTEAARRRAHLEIRSLAAESVKDYGHLVLDHRVVVKDEAGTELFEVRFGDAIEVRAST